MFLNSKKIQIYLQKLQESFLEENEENRKMLDIYLKYAEGTASEDDINYNELENDNKELETDNSRLFKESIVDK